MGPSFVIPIYQRPYSWRPAEIERLFDDILSGLERSISESQALTFLGSTITTSTPDRNEYGPSAPAAIRTVIDGQQRLCTLAMAAIVLHNEILYVRDRTPNPEDLQDPTADGAKWILNQSKQTLTQLRNFIFIDTEAEYDDWPKLPRIIRAGQDRWATTSSKARYASPIARLQRHYISHYEDQQGSTYFNPQPPDESTFAPDDIPPHELLIRRYKSQIRDSIRKIVDPEKKDWLLPSHDRLRQSNTWAPTIVGSHISLEERERILGAAKQDETLGRLVNYILLARFMMDGVHIASVNSTDESYALDMFDSLNTTGQPLTALETFKPRVVAGFNSESDFLDSPVGRKWTNVEQLLDKKPEAQQRTARDVVKTFALAETGTKLPLSLSDQRSWLRKEFENIHSDDAYYFVTQLLHGAAMYQTVWDSPEAEHTGWAPTFRLSDEAQLGISLMNKSNHTIPQAALSRYTFKLATSDADERNHVLSEIGRVTRAAAAFWAIWRAASASTENIDAAHRELMSHGEPGTGLSPLSRRSELEAQTREVPNATYFIAALRNKLAEYKGVQHKDDWLTLAQDQNHYEGVIQVARFLLLAAFHGRLPDPDNPGFLKNAKLAAANKTLSLDRWFSRELSTVEHIAPQRPPAQHDWDPNIYQIGGSHLHAIGNLTLLPPEANSIASNNKWEKKKRLFEAFAAATVEEAKDILHAEGGNSDEEVEAILKVREQLPVLAGLSKVPAWTEQFIRERTQHLLGFAWDTLSDWLEYPSNGAEDVGPYTAK